jgi:iron complex transport system permease protein
MELKKQVKGTMTIKLLMVSFLFLALFLLSFSIGRFPISPDMAAAILLSKILNIPNHWNPDMETIIFQIRLPRILAAALVGSALSVSGAAYQGMFRNPMVSPDILGVTAGASFGAALGMLFSFSGIMIQVSAFVFGLAAVGATCLIGALFAKRGEPGLVMILGGIIIGTLFTSFVSIIKYVADPYNTLPAITFWLMGGLATINIHDIYAISAPILAGMAVLFALRWNLNVLAFGDEEARALGVRTGITRFAIIICATLITAAAVSISGIIALVGLIVPHLARLFVGPDYRYLIPVSIVLGATFLLAVDDLARFLLAVEIPLGIATSIIGAPFFLYLLFNTRKGWI